MDSIGVRYARSRSHLCRRQCSPRSVVHFPRLVSARTTPAPRPRHSLHDVLAQALGALDAVHHHAQVALNVQRVHRAAAHGKGEEGSGNGLLVCALALAR